MTDVYRADLTLWLAATTQEAADRLLDEVLLALYEVRGVALGESSVAPVQEGAGDAR